MRNENAVDWKLSSGYSGPGNKQQDKQEKSTHRFARESVIWRVDGIGLHKTVTRIPPGTHHGFNGADDSYRITVIVAVNV